MRTITFGAANSLDNFIARKDHAVDWLRYSKDVAKIMSDYWEQIDTVLVGRKTYDIGSKTGYPGKKTYVFSRTLEARQEENLEIVTSDAIEFVRELKKQPGKGICVMGGGEFAKCLFEAKLIDEIGFNIHPILLGSGIPLFHEMKLSIELELLECRPIAEGCIYVLYRVQK
jgi:dihydrofolate reductase